jgi:hypothetical protein
MKLMGVGPVWSEMTMTFTGGPVRAAVVVVAAFPDDDALPLELHPAARRLVRTTTAAVRRSV